MRNILLLPFIFLYLINVSFEANAQKGDRENRVKAWKVSFITTELNLTPEEAEKFWPVYNQFEGEMKAVQKKKNKEVVEKQKQLDILSDEEVKALIRTNLKLESEILQIKNKYNGEFEKVLPIRKVAKLYIAEHKFKMMLISVLRGKKDGNTKGQRQNPQNRN